MNSRLFSNVKMSVIALLVCATLPIQASAPVARPEDVGLSSERLHRIHELVQRHIDAGNISGAVTVVARRGRVAHFEAQGVMDLTSKTPMAKDGIFRIMSMTKPVVSVAILMLVEEGKVRLNDPVSKFIPELKGLKVAVTHAGGAQTPTEPRFYTIPAEREITVKDLLTHTGGLVSGQISSREATKFALGERETLADYIPRLGGVPLEFQPGIRWQYSGLAGFDTLARLVEVVSRRSFDSFVRERIFTPLGMKDTFFYPAGGNMRFVTPYRRVEGKLEKQTDPSFINGTYFSGGGGLMSTAEDYLQFALMLAEGGQWNGKRLLSPRTVELMRSPFIADSLPGRVPGEGYGLGVRVITDSVARGTFLSTGSYGWSGAYGTHFWIDPKEQIVGILMIQTPNQELRVDFEDAVMHALVESGGGS